MPDPTVAEAVIEQGKALVRAIEMVVGNGGLEGGRGGEEWVMRRAARAELTATLGRSSFMATVE